jgi:hypothetical protein
MDTVGVQEALEAARAGPWPTLTAISEESRAYAATLALAATKLREAIGAAAAKQIQTVQNSIDKVEETLSGADLGELVEAAREIGDRALSKGLFRPADGWGRFQGACNLLQTLADTWRSRPSIPSNAATDPANAAIRIQSWCRAVVAIQAQLTVIATSIGETAKQAIYQASGDLESRDLDDDIIAKAATAARIIATIVGPRSGEWA